MKTVGEKFTLICRSVYLYVYLIVFTFSLQKKRDALETNTMVDRR